MFSMITKVTQSKHNQFKKRTNLKHVFLISDPSETGKFILKSKYLYKWGYMVYSTLKR